MPILIITNRTSNRLPVGSVVGILGSNETRTKEVTGNELELAKESLISLAASGMIEWEVSPTSTDTDNELEQVLGGAKVLAGTGSPNDSIVGSIGDLYVNKEGSVGTTLYVKESGNGTTSGWIPK